VQILSNLTIRKQRNAMQYNQVASELPVRRSIKSSRVQLLNLENEWKLPVWSVLFPAIGEGMASIVTDPYDAQTTGFAQLKLKADIVTVSHDAQATMQLQP